MSKKQIKETSSNSKKLPSELKPIKVKNKTVDEQLIAKANDEYVANAKIAYQKKINHEILDGEYKKLINNYRNDFFLAIKGKYYEKITELHQKGLIRSSINNLDFNLYALKREYFNQLANNYHNLKLNKSNKAKYDSLKKQKQKIKQDYKQTRCKIIRKFKDQILNKTDASSIKKHFIVSYAKLLSWFKETGRKIFNISFLTIIVIVLILGLVDQTLSNFLITKVSIGSLSVFTFAGLIMLVVYILGMIIKHFRYRAGVYDIVEAKYAKPAPSSGPIGTSSDSANEYEYLDVLFENANANKPESCNSAKEAGKILAKNKKANKQKNNK